MRILIAEDDSGIGRAVQALLERSRYTADLVSNGTDALEWAVSGEYDALILDIMLPGKSGLEVLSELRKLGRKTPVLLLTALTDVPARVRGLDAGADDYLVKPFASDELIARVRAMLRRADNYVPDVLTYGALRLDCSRYDLSTGGGSVRLNNKEFRLMELLMRSPGRVYSTDRLLDLVWGWDAGVDNHVVWTNIANLRRTLRNIGARERIYSVRGEGYSLEGAEC